MSVVVAKVGSSTLVDAQGRVRTDVLDTRVADLARVARQGHRPVLVSSGAIACGFAPLGFDARPTALEDLQASSAVGQGILFRHYQDAFARHGITPAQVLLTSDDIAGRATYLNARTTLGRLVELGAVPVINENDTTATDEVTFGDNDVLAAQVAMLLGATWLVLMTDRDGLYGVADDGSPVLLEDVRADVGPEGVALAALDGSGLGRGGVASKIGAAAMAVGAGITTVVASGTAPDVVTTITHGGRVGTRFRPRAQREPAFKLWLRHAKPSQGRVAVDDGAARALRVKGRSLLAVGVTGASGAFAAGDAVDVVGPSGEPVGKGIAAMSRADLDAVKGLASAAIAERGIVVPAEVIHRDRFVLVDA